MARAWDKHRSAVLESDLTLVLFLALASTDRYMLPTSRRWWQVWRPKTYVQPDLVVSVVLDAVRTDPDVETLLRRWLDDPLR